MSEKDRKRELDDFWDVDSLLPKRQKPIPKAPDTDTVLIEVGGDAPAPARDGNVQKKPLPRPEHPLPDEEYEPENPLIKSVRIYRWRGEYPYYERFYADVRRLYPVHGVEVPYVSFFSFVPQYSQMQRPQLLCYLWWRERFRAGEAPDTEYSYVLLYAYELLNSEELDEPAHILDLMARLWLSYRTVFLQLNSFLPQWIAEYGLIHRLEPPKILLGDALPFVIGAAVFKEYFVSGSDADSYAAALLAFSSKYSYKKSKFYTEKTAATFDKMIPGALSEVARGVRSGDAPFFGLDDSVFHYTKESFTGAICPYRFKRKLEVDYYSFSRSFSMRTFVTNLVKYAENRTRAGLGIRPKLTVEGLDPRAKAIVDAYFEANHFAPAAEPTPLPDYEKNYDLPKHDFSLADAERIEEASWQTTEKLLAAFGEETGEEEVPPPLPAEPKEEDSDGALPPEMEPYRELLSAYAAGDRARIRAELSRQNKREDLLADEINAAFFDAIGDVLLEEDDEGYRVIPDYSDLLCEILAKGKEL